MGSPPHPATIYRRSNRTPYGGIGRTNAETHRLSAFIRVCPHPKILLASSPGGGHPDGTRGRRPPRRFFFAPGSGGFAARARCKTKCILEGFALQTSHLSKPAVSSIWVG